MQAVWVLMMAAALCAYADADDTTCSQNGKTYQVGEKVPMENSKTTCWCTPQGLKFCSCDINGEVIGFLLVFPHEDGCNSCYCLGGQDRMCTSLASCSPAVAKPLPIQKK